MVLDRETIRRRKAEADRIIREYLRNRRNPSVARKPQEITKRVFPDEGMSNQQWSSTVCFVKRRMGAIRYAAYEEIEKQGKKPDFFPFPYPIFVEKNDEKKERFYVYFNAIDSPYYEQNIRRMRGAARGLTRAANLLDSVSDRNGRDDDNGRPPDDGGDDSKGGE
jgi:hypothetical protein